MRQGGTTLAGQADSVRCSPVQHSAAQCSTVQRIAGSSARQFGTGRAVQHCQIRLTQCGADQHSTVQHSADE